MLFRLDSSTGVGYEDTQCRIASLPCLIIFGLLLRTVFIASEISEIVPNPVDICLS